MNHLCSLTLTVSFQTTPQHSSETPPVHHPTHLPYPSTHMKRCQRPSSFNIINCRNKAMCS